MGGRPSRAPREIPGDANLFPHGGVSEGGTGIDVNAACDLHLIVRAQAGDREAVEDLLGIIAVPLRRYLVRVAERRADDILQETLFRIWRNLGWLREPQLFRAWAYRIATREAFRHMRRELRHEEGRADAAALEYFPAPSADPAERLLIESTLSRITPLTRAVLAAHYLEGLTLEETAAATETPLGTVKSRLASGLRQARALMEAAT
jgi:RNA polymerase sigma-70 factor, ECF subfamily